MSKEEIASWKEDCGCKVSAEHIIKMCSAHRKETDEIHARWGEDYKRIKAERDKAA